MFKSAKSPKFFRSIGLALGLFVVFASTVRPNEEPAGGGGLLEVADDEVGAQDEKLCKLKRAPWEEPRNEPGFIRMLETCFSRHYQKQYDLINMLLVNKLPRSQSLAENLEAAEETLEAERKRGVSMFKNRARVEALEQFLDLKKLKIPETKCTHEAYRILWKNNQAVRGRAQRPMSEFLAPRRIETIIHKASVEHTIECFYFYPQRLLELRNTMDQTKLRLVETFLDNLLESRDCIRTETKRVAGKRAAEMAFELIEQNSHNDPDHVFLYKTVDEVKGTLVVKADGVRLLAERYLVEPCREFVYQFGPDVFIPARFGSLVLEKADRYTNTLADFLHSWIHYKLCESLIRRDESALVKGLVRYIERRTQES